MPELAGPKTESQGSSMPLSRAATDAKPDATARKRRSNRRTRTATDGAGTVRYFVGKPCRGNETPELGEEVDSEARALLMGYKGDKHVFLVTEYKVTEVISRDKVGLARQPVSPAPRVSNVNQS